MNLWVSMEDAAAKASDAAAFDRSVAAIAPQLEALGAPRPTFKPYSPIRFEDQVRVLIDANAPAFSFIYGIPAKEILRRMPGEKDRVDRHCHDRRRSDRAAAGTGPCHRGQRV